MTGGTKSMLIDFRPQSSTIVLPCWMTTVPSTVKRTGEPGHEVAVEHVHKHIRSGLNLGDPGIGAGDVVGAGAAGGDDLARKARAAQAVARLPRAHPSPSWPS